MDLIEHLAAYPEISAVSSCTFSQLACRMEESRIQRTFDLCPGCTSVVFALFPYYNGQAEGNLSLYARGQDYHMVVQRILSRFIQEITPDFPGYTFIPLADASPLPEVYGAYLSGCGILGKNGLIFDRIYGSYVFIGTILTDLPLPQGQGGETCPGCGACLAACPTSALTGSGVCLSDLTQTGGAVSPEDASLLRSAPRIWGCDICSQVCPLNQKVPLSPNPAFTQDCIHSLEAEDLNGLTRKEFLRKYPDRAFTWKGPAPLRRNLQLRLKSKDK